MPSFTTLLSLIFIPFLAWLTIRASRLFTNYLSARKLGIPIIVVPCSWQDAWWIIIWGSFRWLRHVPILGYWVDYSHHSWAQDLRYRPHQKLGDAFVIVSPVKNEIMVNDPAAGVELQSHYKTWIKPRPLYDLFETFGKSVISVNGEDWQRHRKIINPAFREQNNRLVWDESLRQARQMLDGVRRRPGHSGTLLDLRNDCVLIAMHVLSAAGFGHAHNFDGGLREVPQGHTKSLAEALMFLLQNILFTVLFSKWTLLGMMMPAKYREINATVKEFRRYMKEIVAYNRATTQGGGGGNTTSADIVSALVEADEAAKREEKTNIAANNSFGLGTAKPMYLSDDELFGNLYVFNLAGFETTANALIYTIPFLAANRDVQEWVGEEVDVVMKGKDKLDYEEGFPLLVRCLALMYETLRLWGPVPDAARWCAGESQSLRVNDHEMVVPADTYVSTNFYGIHSDPRWWGADSLEWRPRRWIRVDEKTGKELIAPPPPGAAFMAWSIGPRICPGRKFSQVEFVAVISSLLRWYRLRPLVIRSKKMKTEEQARRALLQVIDDSMNVVTPKMRRPEDAGVVFIER
ncbi:uncharacterized protein Z518_04964 [Rhinocladiella mackenziei CBS 650.93]|uniref:Cytochrome P450 monooxygenase n=1 Tax=Rhinocladiella mackenziei CBS 650.93 TaxID=1442369 RepID=A0A0D2H944_9EURO|nr:uncharacterized protein Z518_04964 [Rhinocladiella mackenziei CBS 650.93]KIX06988.1 hypothetical protein Z518_04964 [Rhinocladiella mackenziei CBS 650.93]